MDDDPCQAQYYTEHDVLHFFNQLFAVMYDLILCSFPKMGLSFPTPGCSIAEIFEEKIPNIGKNDCEES